MKTRKQLSIGLLLLATISASLQAESRSYGYVTVPLLSGSDTYLSVPFNNQVASAGALESAPVLESELASLTIRGENPNWSTDAYADSHYVRFLGGAMEGLYFTVRSNSNDTLVIDDMGVDFSEAAAGDRFELAPYWTLGTLFPHESSESGLTASTGTRLRNRFSEIYYPNLAGNGINLGTSAIFFFTAADGWLEATSDYSDASDIILYPDTYVIVRQPASVADSEMRLMGAVNSEVLTIMLHTSESTRQDNFVSLNRPVPISLGASGISSGFTESTSLRLRGRKDELYVFDNSSRGINKAASRIFYMYQGTWYDAVDGNNAGDFQLLPANGFVVRKSSSGGETQFAKTYLNN